MQVGLDTDRLRSGKPKVTTEGESPQTEVEGRDDKGQGTGTK